MEYNLNDPLLDVDVDDLPSVEGMTDWPHHHGHHCEACGKLVARQGELNCCRCAINGFPIFCRACHQQAAQIAQAASGGDANWRVAYDRVVSEASHA